MAKVAIAGASGGVGRAIVQSLKGKHDFIVLTRSSASTNQDSDNLGGLSVIADYDDVDGLTQILENTPCIRSYVPYRSDLKTQGLHSSI